MENWPIFQQGDDILPSPTIPWTPRDVAWGLIMAVAWIIVFVILGGLGAQFGLTIDPSVVIIFGTLLLLIPAWYFTIFKYGATWADLGLRRFQPRAVGLGCGLMLLSLLFNLVYAYILAIFNLEIQPDIAQMFDNTGLPLVLLVGGAIVAPLVEEIFFRGFVFAGLRNRWDWKKAAVTSAGLFALAHILPTSILPILILGLIFAFLYQVSGSIWPAIFMHILTNSIALSAAYANSQGWVP
jgi:membrane protease YdiL (CAAX protease family)